jgi:hypothetical protein
MYLLVDLMNVCPNLLRGPGSGSWRRTGLHLADPGHSVSVAVQGREDDRPVKGYSRIVQALVLASFLASLGTRSGNALSLELTAAINDLSPDEKLSEGRLVKIGKKESLRRHEQPMDPSVNAKDRKRRSL